MTSKEFLKRELNKSIKSLKYAKSRNAKDNEITALKEKIKIYNELIDLVNKKIANG